MVIRRLYIPLLLVIELEDGNRIISKDHAASFHENLDKDNDAKRKYNEFPEYRSIKVIMEQQKKIGVNGFFQDLFSCDERYVRRFFHFELEPFLKK